MTLKKIFAAAITAITMTTANATTENGTAPIVNPSDNGPKTEFVYYEGNNATKFVYTCDEQGRVSSKVRYTLNANGKWCPSQAYSVFYGDAETVVTYAAWNENNHSFTKNAKQIHLDAQKYPVAIQMPR